MDNNINNSYIIEIEVITPLHIGAGAEKDWIRGLDFIYHKGKIIKLNTKKLFKVLEGDISKLSNYLAIKNEKGLKTLIADKLNNITEHKFNISVNTTNDIKAFIKTGLDNKPFIPGSSLKGAIRSILLNYFMGNNKPFKLNEKKYFGSSTDGDEFMRFIKISDAHFEKTNLINTKIFNIYQEGNNFKGGWKHGLNNTNAYFKAEGFNTIYEIIERGEKSTLTISLAERQLKNLELYSNFIVDGKKKNITKDLKVLFQIINKHTKSYIRKEIAFFQKYSNNETPIIIDTFENVLSQIPDDNSACVLRMSAGSGFHNITGDWQFDDFSIDQIDTQRRNRGKLHGKPSAKSRKIAVSDGVFMPMGFVKLRLLTEKEIEEINKQEQIKIEQERKHREEQERLQKEQEIRTQQFNSIISEAEKLFNNGKYTQAKLKYEEAQALNIKDLQKEINRCNEKIREKEEEIKKQQKLKELEELARQMADEEKLRQQKNEQKIQRLLESNFASLLEETNYNTGKNLIEKYLKKGYKIENNHLKNLEIFIRKFYIRDNKQWKNFKKGKRWQEIVKWIGKENALQLFNKLSQN